MSDHHHVQPADEALAPDDPIGVDTAFHVSSEQTASLVVREVAVSRLHGEQFILGCSSLMGTRTNRSWFLSAVRLIWRR